MTEDLIDQWHLMVPDSGLRLLCETCSSTSIAETPSETISLHYLPLYFSIPCGFNDFLYTEGFASAARNTLV